MLTHIVLFKFTEPDHAREAQAKLLGLEGRVPSLLEIQAHLDTTRSARSYDLVLITRHQDPEGLAAYQSHPDHQQVGAWLSEHASHVAVVDFP